MSREGAGVAPAWSLADALVLAGAPAGGVTSTSGGMRVPALRALAEPHGHVDPAVGARLASEPPHPPRPDGLSEREAEVLEHIALGETNAEIAGHLSVSVRTVETHRAHIQQRT